MNGYIILAAYRLSVRAAESLVLVRGENGFEMQMRNHNGDLFHRINLQTNPQR